MSFFPRNQLYISLTEDNFFFNFRMTFFCSLIILPLWPSLQRAGHRPLFCSQLLVPSCLQSLHNDSNFSECVAQAPCAQPPHCRHSDSSCRGSAQSPTAKHPRLSEFGGLSRQTIWKRGSKGTEAIIVTTWALWGRIIGIQVGSLRQMPDAALTLWRQLATQHHSSGLGEGSEACQAWLHYTD